MGDARSDMPCSVMTECQILLAGRCSACIKVMTCPCCSPSMRVTFVYQDAQAIDIQPDTQTQDQPFVRTAGVAADVDKGSAVHACRLMTIMT